MPVDAAQVQAAAREHYDQQRGLVAQVVRALLLWWALLERDDWAGSWFELVRPGILSVLVEGQRAAAAEADLYVAGVVGDTGGDLPRVNAAAFAGQAADGRDLGTLLDGALFRMREVAAAGASPGDAEYAGRVVAERAAVAEVQDAGRVADGVAIAGMPQVTGYVRMLVLPSCARCVVLAGRFYRWNAGFQRHLRCDCRHIPAVEAGDALTPVTDPITAVRSGQVAGLSRADVRAVLDDGADLARIVNAGRTGLRTTATGGVKQRARRLTPELIYRRAGSDRDEAVRLLKQHSYLI